MARTPRLGGKATIGSAWSYPNFAANALSGCKLWLDFTRADTYDAGTVGSRPGTLYDCSGNGHNFTQATNDAAHRAIVATGASGNLGLQFDATTQFYTASSVWNLTAMSLVIVTDGPMDAGLSGAREWMSQGATFDTGACAFWFGSSGRTLQGEGRTNNKPAEGAGDFMAPSDRVAIMTLGASGSELLFNLCTDGVLKLGPWSSSGGVNGLIDASASAMILGKSSVGAALQTYRHIAIYDHALSAAEIAQIDAMTSRRHGRAIVVAGNSISDEFYFPFAWTSGLASTLGVEAYVIDGGVSGRTTPQIHSAFAADFAPRVRANEHPILVIMEGTNDLRNGSNAATALANIATVVADGKAAKYERIVVVGVMPGNGINESDRIAVNAALRAGTTNVDAFVDVEADPIIGAAGANLNATYFIDGLHPTAAGHARLLALAAPVIRGVMAT